MKFITLSINYFCLFLGLCFQSSGVLASSSAIELEDTHIIICNHQEICLELSSPKSYGATLAPLYVFKNVTYRLLKKKIKVEAGKGISATINFSENQLVIVSKENQQMKETVFNMKNLNKKVFWVN